MGELFIWTNIDPAYEDDFNKWYDREHMAERAGIPGFMWARRYRSQAGPRPYLALYRTETMHVFRSPAYRQAFEHQTPWSLANFERMRNTNRRVTVVSPLHGVGTGGALALLRLGSLQNAQRAAAMVASPRMELGGVLCLRVLTPDPELSTPLPSEDPSSRVLEPFLVVDTVTEAAAADAAQHFAAALDLGGEHLQIFRLLWELRSCDLAAAR